MALAQVVRSRDRRWRIEVDTCGLMDVRWNGFVLLSRASAAAVADLLAEWRVLPGDLVVD